MSEVVNENRRLLKRLLVAAALMFGFGYLMVPFYEKICEVTGINNVLQADRSPTNTQVDRSRLITVEFDANTHRDLPWSFRPKTGSMQVHPGELNTVSYEVVNTRAEAVTGQAIPSYGPQLAGRYFLMMDCFCFAEQKLDAGEERVMPVAFVIDPDLPEDVQRITLSYTFFELAGRRAQGPAQPADGG